MSLVHSRAHPIDQRVERTEKRLKNICVIKIQNFIVKKSYFMYIIYHTLTPTHHNEKCNKPCEEQLNDNHFRCVDFRI